MKAYLVAYNVLSDKFVPLHTGHQICNADTKQEAKEKVGHEVAKRIGTGYVKIINVNS